MSFLRASSLRTKPTNNNPNVHDRFDLHPDYPGLLSKIGAGKSANTTPFLIYRSVITCTNDPETLLGTDVHATQLP